LAAPLGAERVEAARRALEELATEFEARQARRQKDEKKDEEGDEKEAEGDEPLTRGPLSMKQLSPMGSSAVAEVTVEATFRLARDARGKWRVSEVLIGGESLGDSAAALRSVDAQKAERARAEMRDAAAALESFRRERGFYVVAEDATALMDHLSPRHIKSIVRIDPWHRPYRYAGTREQYTLSSDGPDGKPGTPDDVTHAR
ncbi:MAG TPA: type II secretion system protein GspG, partial [Pyrinomonadaceae bacterium]|nr:type II secretion system protein GspG [Pyrinomonadaceae bacterium]